MYYTYTTGPILLNNAPNLADNYFENRKLHEVRLDSLKNWGHSTSRIFAGNYTVPDSCAAIRTVSFLSYPVVGWYWKEWQHAKQDPHRRIAALAAPLWGSLTVSLHQVTILNKLLAYIKAENLFRLSAFFSPIMKFRQKGWRSSGRLSFFDFDPSWFLKEDWIGYWSNGKGIHLFIPFVKWGCFIPDRLKQLHPCLRTVFGISRREKG